MLSTPPTVNRYEWCVALVICVGVLPLLAYALLLAGKQATRWLRGSSKASRGGLVTAETHERLTKLSVHWGSVCSKVAILCVAYLVLSVIVAKVVVVFLAWLNLLLAPVPLAAVLLIFLLVGTLMFLVPGMHHSPPLITTVTTTHGALITTHWALSCSSRQSSPGCPSTCAPVSSSRRP